MPFVVKTANGRHRFQRPIPPEIRSAFGGKAYWVEALSPHPGVPGTLDEREAYRLSIPVLARVEAQFEAARRGEWPPMSEAMTTATIRDWQSQRRTYVRDIFTEEDASASLREFIQARGLPGLDPRGGNFQRLVNAALYPYPMPIMLAAQAPSARPVRPDREPVGPENPSISSVLAAYLADRHLEEKSKEARGVALAVARFIAIHRDIGIRSITRADAAEFRATLQKLPRRNGGELTEKSVNTYVNWINALCNWAIKRYLWDWSSPFRGLAPKDKRRDAARAYLAYSPDELRTIFASEVFASASIDPRERDERFWLPLLAIHQGRRLDEIGTRLVRDVGHDRASGITYMNVSLETPEQSVKNLGSLGQYPIHEELIRLGFLEYVAGLKARGETRLFPQVTSTPGNPATGAFSQWWTRYRRKIGITGERKKFHSFRSNWTQTARNAGVPKDIRFALAGRETGDTETVHYGGSGFALTLLAAELCKVRFDIDLSRLYVKAEAT